MVYFDDLVKYLRQPAQRQRVFNWGYFFYWENENQNPFHLRESIRKMAAKKIKIIKFESFGLWPSNLAFEKKMAFNNFLGPAGKNL